MLWFVLIPQALALPAAIQLPEAEPADRWDRALDVAGFEVDPDAERTVTITSGAAIWTVEVRGADGTLRRAEIAPPASEDDREEVTLLAASLLTEATPALPRLPRLTEVPWQTAPSPGIDPDAAWAAPHVPSPPPDVDEVTPTQAAPARRRRRTAERPPPAPVVEPAGRPGSTTRFWLSGRGGGGGRALDTPFGAAAALGGVRLGPAARLGAGLQATTPITLPRSAGEGKRMRALDALAGAWATHWWMDRIGIDGGGFFAASQRRFTARSDARWSPVLGLDLAPAIRASRHLTVRAPTLRVERDLVSTTILIGSTRHILNPWAVHVEVDLVFSTGRDQSDPLPALQDP